jgi:LacI family transcriptional regulator
MRSFTFLRRFFVAAVGFRMALARGGELDRSMSSRRKVALLVETSNTYGRELLHGVRAWAREQRTWSVRLSEHARGAGLPAWLRTWEGDGVIARVDSTAVASALRRLRVPVVDVSASRARPVFPRVVTDSAAVTRLALEHLRERGLRQFGYCGDARFRWAAQRGKFFAAQVREAGGTLARFVAPVRREGRVDLEAEMVALVAWLRGLPKPVGVLACYDVRGQQVLEACQEAGLAVPEEVAVIGVHNDDLLCELCDPPLSSVMPDARRAGYEAAQLLERMMAGETLPVTTRLIEPLGVAARQSTDVVAVADARVAAAVRFIRERAGQGIDVGDVLRAVPMSRTLLERRFKQLLGHTPHEHIQRVRLERVKTLLATTELGIGTIAERVGFEHAEYLSVAFRRATGLTPRAYRSEHRTAR